METTDLTSGMPLVVESDVTTKESTMSTITVKPGLQPLLAYLNPEDRARFITLANEAHPLTGQARQEKVMLSVAEDQGRKYRTFRMAAGVFKLGDPEFTQLAQYWYDGSYELAGLYMKACRQAGWKVRTHKTAPALVSSGYIWVSKK